MNLDADDIVNKVDEETIEDTDSISYFNRKYKDASLPITIPGSFHKVRAQGGAAPGDSVLIDQLNKRSFATFALIMFHCKCVSEFFYQSRIISP